MRRLSRLIMVAIAVMLAAVTTGCARRAVAKVNGDIITEREFFDRLQVAQGRQVLDRLILEKLVEQKAKQKKIEVTEAETNQFVQGLKRESGDRWAEYLRAAGQTEEDVRRDVRDSMLIVKLIIPESEMKRYWERNRTRFDEPATVTYRRVVLGSKAEAEKVRGQIVSGKLTFAQAVKTLSKDPVTQEPGGEIGPIPQGYGDPDLDQTLFSIPLKQVSEPLPAAFAQDAYQLVEVGKRTAGRKVSFSEAESRVIRALTSTRQQEISDFLSDLRAEASVTILSQRYQSLAEQYARLKQQKPPKIGAPAEKPAATRATAGTAPAKPQTAPEKRATK